MSKFPSIHEFPLLVEKCIHEPDQDGDHQEFHDTLAHPTSSGDNQEDVLVTEAASEVIAEVDDLIDFSDEPLPVLNSSTDQDNGEINSNDAMQQIIDLMF